VPCLPRKPFWGEGEEKGVIYAGVNPQGHNISAL